MKRALIIAALTAVTFGGFAIPSAYAEESPTATAASTTSPDIEIAGVSVLEGYTTLTVGEQALDNARDAAMEDEA